MTEAFLLRDESPYKSPSNDAAPKFVRYTLWELFVLTTLVCATGGLFVWLTRGEPELFLLLVLSVMLTIGYFIHLVTRWSLIMTASTTVILAVFGFCLLLPISRGTGPRDASRRMQCSNHLKQIGLALQNYHDTYGTFPPAYLAGADGKPVHSWRVLILPFMENKPLYDKYSFAEPWDGPNNRLLHKEVIHAYTCPSRGRVLPTETSYVAVVGPGTLWPGPKATKMGDLTDGTSNTLLVVEIAKSGIHWMEPRDLDAATMPLAINATPGPSISSDHPSVALAVFADGHTQALTKDTPPHIIEGLMTIAGGETIGDY